MSRQPLNSPSPLPSPAAALGSGSGSESAPTSTSTSTSTERRTHRAPSVKSFTSSIDTLIEDNDNIRCNHGSSYRGFRSEEEYLGALRDWVESKAYYESDTQLSGWYGTKTKQDYLDEPSIFTERRAQKKAEKRQKQRRHQHAQVDRMGALAENDESEPQDESANMNRQSSLVEQQHQHQHQQHQQHRPDAVGGSKGSEDEAPTETMGRGRRGSRLRRLSRVFSSGKRG